MSTLLYARAPREEREERQVRQLAHSAHAPADWVVHAQMIARSWDGWRTSAIAVALGCHMQTVRERLQAFNERGLDGLGLKPGGGRKPRITQAQRSAVIALTASPPPGRLVTSSEGTVAPAGSARGEAGATAEWSLDALAAAALAAAAQAQGIQIGRSQVRRILRTEGVRWRRTPTWGSSTAKGAQDLAPKERPSSLAPPTRPQARRRSASMNWDR